MWDKDLLIFITEQLFFLYLKILTIKKYQNCKWNISNIEFSHELTSSIFVYYKIHKKVSLISKVETFTQTKYEITKL